MGILSKLARAVSPKRDATEKPEPDAEIAALKGQLEHGNLNGLRDYLRQTRKTRDWQDRIYVLNHVVDQLPQAALQFACEKEPDAADLALIFTAYYADLARKRRGSGTCEKIEEMQWVGAAEALQTAIGAVQASIKRDPDDPTSRAIILRSLTIFGELRPMQQQFFEQIVGLAPDCVDAYDAMARSSSKRWHGSHEESLAIARRGLANTTAGSDVAGALFRAHELVKGHLQHFDKDLAAAAKYVNNPDVVRELTEAFDRWTGPGYVPRRSSIAYLDETKSWFWAFNDRERMEKAKSLVEAAHRSASQSQSESVGVEGVGASASVDPDDHANECLGLVSVGADLLREKETQKALLVFISAAKDVKFFQLDSSLDALVNVHIALACGKLGKTDESRKYLNEGLSIADRADYSKAPAKVLRLMAAALEELDAIRAAKFFELLILSGEGGQDPPKLASLLRRMGRCYGRAGLHDHAVIPLRASLRIYRSSPADPLLPGVLLDLGNALRKTAPAEAEALYREAAGIHEAQMQFVSATTAWVNLGLIYSEQGRNEEALQLYQKVLNIREKTPNTPASRIAGVLNNMAGCYRRMKQFGEAHAAIDRAIRLTKPDEPSMPSFYGTRGEIFLDEGQGERSLEWTRKAISIREKQTSPDRAILAENYEKEISALQQLGRKEEAEQTSDKLTGLRAAIQSTPKTETGTLNAPESIEGAVFVELPFGASKMTPKSREQVSEVASALSAKVREGAYGLFSGTITVPEHVTFIFYGPNAELLHMAIEPILTAERICAGARVRIQQNGAVREKMVGMPRTSVN